MRKLTRKYYFSVEGETEKAYLKWLEKSINGSDCKYSVSFSVKVQKDPLSFVKGLCIQEKTIIFHLCDYESDETCHQQQFERTMSRMRESEKQGKCVAYRLGYSNFTFDLWIVLHKMDCNGPLLSSVKQTGKTLKTRDYSENSVRSRRNAVTKPFAGC